MRTNRLVILAGLLLRTLAASLFLQDVEPPGEWHSCFQVSTVSANAEAACVVTCSQGNLPGGDASIRTLCTEDYERQLVRMTPQFSAASED